MSQDRVLFLLASNGSEYARSPINSFIIFRPILNPLIKESLRIQRQMVMSAMFPVIHTITPSMFTDGAYTFSYFRQYLTVPSKKQTAASLKLFQEQLSRQGLFEMRLPRQNLLSGSLFFLSCTSRLFVLTCFDFISGKYSCILYFKKINLLSESYLPFSIWVPHEKNEEKCDGFSLCSIKCLQLHIESGLFSNFILFCLHIF